MSPRCMWPSDLKEEAETALTTLGDRLSHEFGVEPERLPDAMKDLLARIDEADASSLADGGRCDRASAVGLIGKEIGMAQTASRLTLLKIAAVLFSAGLASGAQAQSQTTKPRVPTTLPPSGSAADTSRRAEPAPPAPSVDTNPNVGRGQSYYPPRATTGTPPR